MPSRGLPPVGYLYSLPYPILKHLSRPPTGVGSRSPNGLGLPRRSHGPPSAHHHPRQDVRWRGLQVHTENILHAQFPLWVSHQHRADGNRGQPGGVPQSGARADSACFPPASIPVDVEQRSRSSQKAATSRRAGNHMRMTAPLSRAYSNAVIPLGRCRPHVIHEAWLVSCFDDHASAGECRPRPALPRRCMAPY
jgi:hypothetical protein